MNYFNNKKTFIWAIVVLVLLNFFSLAALFIQHKRFVAFVNMPGRPNFDHHPRTEKSDHFLTKEVGFNNNQIEEVKKLREIHIDKMKSLNVELHQLKKQLIDGAFSDDFTSEMADEIIMEVANVQVKIEEANHDHLMKMKKICTPDQQPRLKNLLEEAFTKHRPDFMKGEKSHLRGHKHRYKDQQKKKKNKRRND